MRLAISRSSHCLPSRSAACSWLQAYTSVSYGVIIASLEEGICTMYHPSTNFCLIQGALSLCRLAPNGVDDLIHAGHPCHTGKDNVHTGVVLLHRRGGAA